MNVLVIEDEPKLAEYVMQILKLASKNVTVCDDVDDVIESKYAQSHDLIVLDLMLAGKKSGLDLVTYLKKEKIQTPVIVLTALNQISTKIDLFNAGVDDYITKPFEAPELLARLKSVYRRYLNSKIEDEITIEDLTFQRKENIIIRGERKTFLTSKEGELLLFLIQNMGKIVRSEDILNKVWNTKVGFHSNILQATVRRLRKKVDNDFSHKYIKNVHGVGYTFDV